MLVKTPGNVIYLPIRSFGDFIITASVIKRRIINKIPILLPEYLTEFFFAINGDELFEVVNTIEFKNQPAFFELYTVRSLKNITRLINDYRYIYRVLNRNDKFILDYSSKRLFFAGANLVWPAKNENIYEAKLKLFTDNVVLKPEGKIGNTISFDQFRRIIIIPDSRIKEKSISSDLIKKIINKFKNHKFDIAFFSKEKKIGLDSIYYSNFNELIHLIITYDLVITAESLPYHLANYLGKPHFVIYNQSRHFKKTFMTPFMTDNNFYSLYNGSNFEAIINDIGRILR
jgi:hypothetical protein